MNKEAFDDLLKTRLEKITNTLMCKSKEYASDKDRFYHFKIAAEIQQTTPKKALWGMAVKHLVSVMNIVESDKPPTVDLIDEKVGDLINYLILLEGVLKER